MAPQPARGEPLRARMLRHVLADVGRARQRLDQRRVALDRRGDDADLDLDLDLDQGDVELRDLGFVLGVLSALGGGDALLARNEPRAFAILQRRLCALLRQEGRRLPEPFGPLEAIEPGGTWRGAWAAVRMLERAVTCADGAALADGCWTRSSRAGAHVLTWRGTASGGVPRPVARLGRALARAHEGASFSGLAGGWELSYESRRMGRRS